LQIDNRRRDIRDKPPQAFFCCALAYNFVRPGGVVTPAKTLAENSFSPIALLRSEPQAEI